jgi:hypothetical protein
MMPGVILGSVSKMGEWEKDKTMFNWVEGASNGS